MPVQFGREWYVIVGGLEVRGLRITFRAAKSLSSDPNTLDLRIYNLSATTRARMQKKSVAVVLAAGYEGSSEVIFSGDARTIDHVREGAEWMTHVQCGDGERAYQTARSAFSFKAGTSVQALLNQVIGDLPVNTQDALRAVKTGQFALAFEKLQQGYTAQGRSVRELDRALAAHGIEWSIQKGTLQLLQGNGTTKQTAVVLSPATGLIGSPDHGAPQKAGMPHYLKLKCLLHPGIEPGRALRLETQSISGDYRAEKVEHTGDSHGQEWNTDVEALPR
jgi:hypothetical protein